MPNNMLTMQDVNLAGKRVIIREDFNVPMKNGEILSPARILAAIPTIQAALEQNSAILLLSHLGRPEEHDCQKACHETLEAFSLQPVADFLSQQLNRKVSLIKNWIRGVSIQPGEIFLGENVRFNSGEVENSPELSQQIAALCDVYIMDAFATAHRAEASTCGVLKYAPIACAGPLLIKELKALEKVFDQPKRPVVAVVGGAKVSTKLKLLYRLLEKVDVLILGGGIANTFLAAMGYSVGNSLHEVDFIDEALRLIELAQKTGKLIPLPTDIVVKKQLCHLTSESYVQTVNDISDDEKILDIGPETSRYFAQLIETAKTILWNGPVGAFEQAGFSHGTESIAQAIAANKTAFSVVGGGDTLVVLEKYNILDKVSYVSTGGGAFLSYLEGAALPAVEALKERYAR